MNEQTEQNKPAGGESELTVGLGVDRVSTGRNPNIEDCCGYPKCAHLKVDGDKAFGWCQHTDNYIGFTPSVSFTGYCCHHTARYP